MVGVREWNWRFTPFMNSKNKWPRPSTSCCCFRGRSSRACDCCCCCCSSSVVTCCASSSFPSLLLLLLSCGCCCCCDCSISCARLLTCCMIKLTYLGTSGVDNFLNKNAKLSAAKRRMYTLLLSSSGAYRLQKRKWVSEWVGRRGKRVWSFMCVCGGGVHTQTQSRDLRANVFAKI